MLQPRWEMSTAEQLPLVSEARKVSSVVGLFRVVAFVVRLVLGGLFIASSLPKLQQPYDFLAAVYDYSLVGPRLGLLIAITLPWLELVLGICLLAGVMELGAYALAVVLFSVFTFARACVVIRGIPVPCGCFGIDRGGPLSLSDVLLTALMLVAAIVMFCSLLQFGPRDSHR